MLWALSGRLLYQATDGSCLDYGLTSQGLLMTIFILFYWLKDFILESLFTGFLVSCLYGKIGEEAKPFCPFVSKQLLEKSRYAAVSILAAWLILWLMETTDDIVMALVAELVVIIVLIYKTYNITGSS